MEKKRYYGFGKHFREVIEEHAKDVGQKQLAVMLDTGQSVISKAKTGDKLPPDYVLEKMKELWGVDLLTEAQELRAATRYGSRNIKAGEKSPKKSYLEGVPYYDVDFIGGFDEIINDQTIIPAYLINFKPYEKATCWCNITGHSMEPEINHGDIIALRKIEDWSFLPLGEIYAIVTKNEMRTVKRLGPGRTDHTYSLIPSNRAAGYAPQEIEKDNIRFVYEVMGCMKKF